MSLTAGLCALMIFFSGCSSKKSTHPKVVENTPVVTKRYGPMGESRYGYGPVAPENAMRQIEKHEILSNLHRDAAQCLREGKSSIECNRKLKNGCNYAGITTSSCEAGL